MNKHDSLTIMIPRRLKKLLRLFSMYAVVLLLSTYFVCFYSPKQLESFPGLNESPLLTRRDYARVAHLVPQPRYEDVYHRLHLKRLHPATKSQGGAGEQVEGWQCRNIPSRDYRQEHNLKPSTDTYDGTSYKGRVYSPEVLTSQRYDKWNLITESNEFTPCIVHVSMNINNFTWCSHPFFPRALTRDMHDEYIQLMDTLTSLLRSVNVTFVMGSGTLLGSYMFHDIIPWDDDMDLWLDYNDLPMVKRLFRNHSLHEKHTLTSFWNSEYGHEYHINTLMQFSRDAPDSDFFRRHQFNDTNDFDEEYVDDIETNHHVFKFHQKTSAHAGSYPWRWPFIDVSYYRQNSTHVWNHKPAHAATWPKSLFFPLVQRPLGRLRLPAPWDTRRVLQWKYGRLHCARHGWDHIREQPQEKFTWIRCSQLYHYVPVVWPGCWIDGQQVENLRLQNTTLQTLKLQGAFHPESLDEPRMF